MRTPRDKTSLSIARKNLKMLLRNDFSYGKLSDELGVSKGMLWRFIVKGWIPKDAEKQRILGIETNKVKFCQCGCGQTFVLGSPLQGNGLVVSVGNNQTHF